MSAERALERVTEVWAASLIDAITEKVTHALRLERDRFDAELADLRDELHEGLTQKPAGADELELESVNRRIASLTESVAALMVAVGPLDEGGHSVAAEEGAE